MARTPKSGGKNGTAVATLNHLGGAQLGIGRAVAHHGELLNGLFEDQDGGIQRAVVTLPMVGVHSIATFWPRETRGIRTRPTGRAKAARAAALTLNYLGRPELGGDLTIESEIPLGRGFGSSTADVVASIRATAAACGVTLRRMTISRLAVAAEGESDAAAYGDQALLFAVAEGRVIELYGELPPLLVVSFSDTKPATGRGSASRRPRYESEDVQLFAVLRGLLSTAIRRQDARLLGLVATRSAQINLNHRAWTLFDAASAMAREHHACGIQIANSGALFGALFDPQERGGAKRARRFAERMNEAGLRDVSMFSVSADGAFSG